MRIAYFTDTYEPQINGVVTTIKLYVEQLRKLGHEVYIFCPSDNKLRKNKYIHTFKSFEFKPYPSYRVGIPNPKIFSLINKISPDIIHIHSPASLGVIGLATAKRLKIPVIMTYHTLLTEYLDYIPGSKNKIIRKINKKTVDKYTKWFYNRSDITIVPSGYTKNFLKKTGVKKEVFVLPTGIKFKDLKFKKRKNKKPIILHVGRICKEKNIDVVIKAFKELKKSTDIKLIITSFGPAEKELKELVKELGLKKNVKFTGYISEREKNSLYKKADLFVTASTTDTQGLVLLEAMQYGTPIIAASAGGFKDCIKNNYNGILFKPGNINDLAKKMKEVLDNKRLWKRLSKNGYENAKKLSIENCTKSLENIYNMFMRRQKVSVIIPTYSEERYIGKTLRSVKKQNYKNLEIIVVDSDSSDKTVKIAKKYADKVIVTKKRGIALGRNLGASAASGDIFLFLDADTVLEKNFINRIVEKFNTPDVVGVCGYIRTYGSLVNRITYKLCSEIAWLSTILKIPLFYGMCMAWRNNIFKDVGGFDEHLITGEDIDITRKMARHGKCILVRNAVAITSPRRITGMGLGKAVAFHVKNFFKIILLKEPEDYYPVAR